MSTRVNFNGYAEAARIDKRVNNLLERFPPNTANWSDWVALTRTLRTTLDIVDHLVDNASRKRPQGKG